MRITIVGAGAIGGVIGSLLLGRGRHAEFVDVDEEHVAAINAAGFKLIGQDATQVVPARAYTPQEILDRGTTLQAVLLCVKAQHTRGALVPLLPLFDRNTFVISIQNGLCEFEIAEIAGVERTIGGFVNIFADYLEPGVVSYGGKGALYVGELDGSITTRLREIQNELSVLDRIEVSTNIFGFLWAKLAYGAILTATALTNETMHSIIGQERYRNLLMDIAGEVLQVAHHAGVIPVAFDDWNPADAFPIAGRDAERMNRQLDIHVERLKGYSKVYSGVWRDIAIRKRPTEKHHHFEPIFKMADQDDIPMPLCRLLMKLLAEIERGEREFSCDNLEELLVLDQRTYGNKQ